MRLRGVRLRVSVRGMVVLVAGVGGLVWGVLWWVSPARRLEGLLGAGQPAFVRREAAASLGREIPSWETDRAVRLLIQALGDPEPRVREGAAVGLNELGSRAEAAIETVVAHLDDPDRHVRFTMARVLASIVPGESPKRLAVIESLRGRLADDDPLVRLGVAGSMVELGETRESPAVVAAACFDDDSLREGLARRVLLQTPDQRVWLSYVVERLRDSDPKKRQKAYEILEGMAPLSTLNAALDALATDDDPELQAWVRAKRARLSVPTGD